MTDPDHQESTAELENEDASLVVNMLYLQPYKSSGRVLAPGFCLFSTCTWSYWFPRCMPSHVFIVLCQTTVLYIALLRSRRGWLTLRSCFDSSSPVLSCSGGGGKAAEG